jgi:hypothetical protein
MPSAVEADRLGDATKAVSLAGGGAAAFMDVRVPARVVLDMAAISVLGVVVRRGRPAARAEAARKRQQHGGRAGVTS